MGDLLSGTEAEKRRYTATEREFVLNKLIFNYDRKVELCRFESTRNGIVLYVYCDGKLVVLL